jgi:glycogen debranching enzyme
VQGYVFEAKKRMARCARGLGFHERGQQLDDEAARLKTSFEETFWLPDLETYALALDGQKRPCRVRSSNAGHLLFSGIVGPERGAIVARELLRPRFFSGWGIRTIAKDEPRYNPMSYHNGSIWPHDNALIALGLARYGDYIGVDRVFRALTEAASYMELRRLPELFCGFQRAKGRGPTLYPVACTPQPGRAPRHSPCLRRRSVSSSTSPPARYVCATRACPISSTRSSSAICASEIRASIF